MLRKMLHLNGRFAVLSDGLEPQERLLRGFTHGRRHPPEVGQEMSWGDTHAVRTRGLLAGLPFAFPLRASSAEACVTDRRNTPTCFGQRLPMPHQEQATPGTTSTSASADAAIPRLGRR